MVDQHYPFSTIIREIIVKDKFLSNFDADLYSARHENSFYFIEEEVREYLHDVGIFFDKDYTLIITAEDLLANFQVRLRLVALFRKKEHAVRFKLSFKSKWEML